jgi:hypothetical protein
LDWSDAFRLKGNFTDDDFEEKKNFRKQTRIKQL